MLVQWNKEHIKHVSITPIPGKPVPKKSFVRLLPGPNEISELEWEYMKPHVKDSIDRGDLEEVGAKTQSGPNKPVQIAKKLSELSAKPAIELVKKTLNPDTLNKWLGEPRLEAAVRLAVEERIKELEIVRDPIEPVDEEAELAEAEAAAAKLAEEAEAAEKEKAAKKEAAKKAKEEAKAEAEAAEKARLEAEKKAAAKSGNQNQ